VHIEISLALPRDRESVSAVRRIVASAMAEVGVERSCAADVELALTEGCANVVRHATSTDRYQVTFELNRDAAKVTIADSGLGFEVNGRQRMAGALAEGGRGLALMRMLMDEADFRVQEGRGTRVMLTKQIVLDETSLLRDAGFVDRDPTSAPERLPAD
jgi:serine/threonine-protein kinase RsbW